MKRILAFYILFLLLSFLGRTQDTQFSQFYAAPLYINPAFTGSTIQHRMILNSRYQWPNVGGGFKSTHASYELNTRRINSGFGLSFFHEEAGIFALSTQSLSLSYAYRFKVKRKMFIHAGLKAGYALRGIDYSKLLFNDQLETESSLTADNNIFSQESRDYADLGAGVLVYGEKYWAGASVDHLNEPDQSLLNDGTISRLPRKFSVHAGYKFKINKFGSGRGLIRKEILTAVHYKSQGKYDQFDMGVYFSHSPVIFGFWYRGIPGLKAYEPGYQNNDAVIFLLGYRIPERKLRFGYTYDVTISRLITETGGSHEISIIYEVANKRERSRKRRFTLPCADF